MSAENVKQVVRQLMDAHVRNDVARVRELLSSHLVWHSGGARDPMGRDDYLKGLEMGAKAFSDHAYTIDDLIAEGDRVAMRLTVKFRHTGEFLGIAPTGRSLTFAGMWFYKIVDSQVVEAWHIDEDILAKLRA